MSFLLKEKGKWVRLNELFQIQKKNKTITLRVSDDLLNEVKKIAKDEDMDYQKLIRNIIIEYVAKKAS
jgi:predicted DNA binding CopG/RHH family protein